MDDDDYLSEGSDDDEPRGKKSKGKGGSSSPSGKKSPVPKVDRPQRKRKLTDKLKDALKSNDDEEDGPASGSDDERFEKKRRVGSRGRPKAEGVQKTPRKSDQEMKEPKQKKEKLYCTCKKPWRPDDPEPMIQCDTCNEWYHFKCVGLQFREEDAQQLEAATYECDTCAEARLNRENAQNGMPIQDAGVMQGVVPMQQQQVAISYGNCKQCGATVVITDASEPCCLCKNQSRDYCQNCFAMQECVQCSKVACSLCRQAQKAWSTKCTGSNDCASRFCEDCQRQDSKGEYKCVGCGNCQCDDSSQHQLLSKCSVQGCNQVACPNCAAKVFTATATGQPLCAAHKDAAGATGVSAPQVQPPVQQQPEVVSAAPVEQQQQQAPVANGAPPS